MNTDPRTDLILFHYFDDKASRKPKCWDEADEIKTTTDVQRILFSRLPIIVVGWAIEPTDSFIKESDTSNGRCIVKWKGRSFYVNTEGYDYARYAAELV